MIDSAGNAVQAATPSTVEDLSQLLESRAASRTRTAFLGRGSKLAVCRPQQHAAPDAFPTEWISTESLVPPGSSGIVEYVPGDGTLTAFGGAPIETLRAAAAEGGHRITPMGPVAGATLGGILAAGASSIDRPAFGPLRHHVLGMHVLDASGRGVAKTGGRLVKNVTGFDLHRLHTGACGTLGIILEASLRLAPEPEAEVLLVSGAFTSAEEATACALGLRADRRIQPRALFVANGRVHLVLNGRTRQVDVERAAAHALASWEETHETGVPAEALRRAERTPGLRLETAPSRIAGAVSVIERYTRDLKVSPYVEPDAAFVEISAETVVAMGLETLHSALAEFDAGAVHATSHLDLLRSTLLARHPSPTRIAEWHRRLRAAFDPAGILQLPAEATS